MRQNYEMTQAQLDRLLSAMKPEPYIIIGGVGPRSVQEKANEAWARLGAEMDFDPMTVRPTGQGNRYFSAVSTLNGDDHAG